MGAENEDYSDLDPPRHHSQEPAEGSEEPGEPIPSTPHAEVASEGEE